MRNTFAPVIRAYGVDALPRLHRIMTDNTTALALKLKYVLSFLRISLEWLIVQREGVDPYLLSRLVRPLPAGVILLVFDCRVGTDVIIFLWLRRRLSKICRDRNRVS